MPASVLVTIIGSLGLIATGVGFYIGTGMEQGTSLIPAFIGLPILVCGLASIRPAKRKLFMHIAVVLAVVGFMGGMRVFSKWEGMEVNARIAHIILLVICLTMIVVFIGSFIQARKQPKPDAGGNPA